MKQKCQETINLKELAKGGPIELGPKNSTTIINPNDLREDIFNTLISAIKKGFSFSVDLLGHQFLIVLIFASLPVLLLWEEPDTITMETLISLKEMFVPSNLDILKVFGPLSVAILVLCIAASIIKNHENPKLIKKQIIKEVLICIINNIFNLAIVKTIELKTYVTNNLILGACVTVISSIYYYEANKVSERKVREQ